MELEILDKRENPLLDRIEVDFVIQHANKSTPKRNAIRDMLSKELKVTKERVVVDNMRSDFGRGQTKGYAKVYSKKEVVVQIEREHLLKRNHLIGEPPKEKKEKPVEEKAEAPAEEKTEKKPAAEEKPAEKPAEEKPAAEKPDEKPAEKPADKKEG